jgi:hypothetical protein
MLNPRKLSQDPIYPNLLPRDRFVLLRSPLDELDAARRNGTASLDTVAAALASRLPANYLALPLADAKALRLADPPGVVPGRLYGITGDWNATGIASTVYVHGVRPDAYHSLGIVFIAQGAGQLVEVDVVAGTYGPLSPTKADLDVNGQLVVAQLPEPGRGLIKDVQGRYAYDDGALLQVGKLSNTRIDPATGQYRTVFGWTTLEFNATQGVTYLSDILKIQYSSYQLSSGARRAWYVEPAGGTPAASFVSTAPVGGAPSDLVRLGVSVLNADVASLHIAPRSGYDDSALAARISALEVQGGRFRGPWAASAAYKQHDMVLQAGSLYYAGAAFTSGSAFDASKWTLLSVGGGSPVAGGVDYTTELIYTAATTLSADAAYKSHVFSGNNPFTLTLPAASTCSGKLLAVRVRSTAQAVFTVAAQGSDLINSDSAFPIWTQEALTLLSTGTGWTKVSSRLRGMSADIALEVGANVTIGADQYQYNYRLPLTRELTPPTPGMHLAGTGLIKIQRSARYLVAVRGRADFSPGNYKIEPIIFRNQAVSQDFLCPPGLTGGETVAILAGSMTMQLNAGDEIAFAIYCGNSSAAIWSDASRVPQHVAALLVTEIL